MFAKLPICSALLEKVIHLWPFLVFIRNKWAKTGYESALTHWCFWSWNIIYQIFFKTVIQGKKAWERDWSIILLFFHCTLSVATGTLHQDLLLTGNDHVESRFRSWSCFKTEEHSTMGTLLASPCRQDESVPSHLQLITFPGHSLNLFVEKSDSIEENQR